MLRIAIVLLAAMSAVLRADSGAQSQFQQGLRAVKEQRLPAAEQAFRSAIVLEPKFTSARKNLATVLWFLNRHAESEAEFRIVEKAIPHDPVAHLYLGLAATERREFAAATGHFESAGDLALKNPETRPAVLNAYLGVAYQYDQQGLSDKAYAAYQKALQLDPDAIAAHVSLAAFASAHGNNAFALGTLQAGLERKPGSAALLLERGIIQALQGLFADADESLRESARADPTNPIAQLALGLTQLQRGNTTEAIITLRDATIRWPGNGRAQYLYALALHRSGDLTNRAEMIAALRVAIQLDVKDAGAHALLGRALLDANQLTTAVRELEQAVKLDAGNETALYQLATAYRTLGRASEAQRAFEEFRKVKTQAKAQESELVQLLKTVPAE